MTTTRITAPDGKQYDVTFTLTPATLIPAVLHPATMVPAVLQQATMDPATIQPESLIISSVVPVPDAPPPVGDSWTTTFSQTFTSDQGGWGGYNMRQLLPAALLSVSGTKVRLTLSASSSAGCSIDGCYIGHQALSGDPYDFDGGQAQVKVGGSGSFSIGAGTSVVTDATTFTLDETKNLIVAIHFNAASAVRLGGSTGTLYYKSAANQTSVTNVSGYSADNARVLLVGKIEVVEPTGGPAGGQITNFTPINSALQAVDGVWQLDGANVNNQNANQYGVAPWALQKLDDYALRFEVRAGDWWAQEGVNPGHNRNEVSVGLDQSDCFPEGVEWNISYTLTIEPGPTSTAGFLTLTQVHATTDVPPCPFVIGLQQNTDKLQVVLQSPQSVNNYIYTSPTGIVRGKAYSIRCQGMMQSAGGGYARVWIDGVQVVNFNGAIGSSLVSPSLYWVKFGLYRGQASETTSAVFRNVSIFPNGT